MIPTFPPDIFDPSVGHDLAVYGVCLLVMAVLVPWIVVRMGVGR